GLAAAVARGGGDDAALGVEPGARGARVVAEAREQKAGERVIDPAVVDDALDVLEAVGGGLDHSFLNQAPGSWAASPRASRRRIQVSSRMFWTLASRGPLHQTWVATWCSRAHCLNDHSSRAPASTRCSVAGNPTVFDQTAVSPRLARSTNSPR